MRNIGISAHIDSGKTTLTERILYYCKKIHRIHEVKGKEGGGATMDYMELERERGITITSATTNVTWNEHSINIIDTPGHVDFTIEVERSLRVLDGAILVLCSVGGVQSQTLTVDKQLKRYNVPAIAFVNKLDRIGANPFKVKDQINDKLGRRAALLQVPVGLEDKFQGLVDLIRMKAYYFDGPNGELVREEEIPPELEDLAWQYREELLDAVSLFSDEVTEAILEDRVTEGMLLRAIRKGTISREFTPVLMGSAYRNKGVQLLLDAVVNYLPDPSEVENIALDLDREEKPVILKADPALPCVSYAFKLEEGPYGQLTYIRIYQGSLRKGDELYNTRSKQKFKVGRVVRMHADHMEDIEGAVAGDIAALFGVDCASGDTICSPGLNYAMTSIYVPEPVISLAIEASDKLSADRLAKALNRFTKEDPTFRVYIDPESKQTIIQGMGELHLDVYVERMKREYRVEVVTGRPQVAYREAITARADFDYTHKKQTGGAGQFGRVIGYIEPFDGQYEFVNEVKGGHIPREFIPSCDKGFQAMLKKGQLIGSPIIGLRVVLTDGQFHPVDSSDIAFQMAAQGAFKQAYKKARPQILEPIMKVVVETPSEFSGNVFGSLNQRRGIIVSSIEDGSYSRIEAEVPLSEMFGYSTILRSMTQGKAEFTMEFLKYSRLPASLAEQLMEEHRQKLEAGDKK
ncbi:MAG: Translation elongation factor G [Candidatus Saccharicenans subterraneus]|uniref:Elongation factor G n=1 Tax=Candidatus Saccharicenans subterraneus TaxID=2508984 RepID=A0A3E2BLW2_9BACT|nr:MAG: Translation elongation factor G [Candidatus Saccharicenans subterraneum]